MKTSRYFASLIETYAADMHELATDYEGRDVLDKRLAEKRQQFDALLPMAAEMPELLAPALHRAFEFRSAKDAEQLLSQGPEHLPLWPKVKPMLKIAPWAEGMVRQALAHSDGDDFLVIAALLDHAYLVGERMPVAADEDEATDENENDDGSDEDDDQGLTEAGDAWLEQQGFDRVERDS